jgi:hypothetical protein
MNLLALLVVVLLQIGLFQFLSVFLTRAFPAVTVGGSDLPPRLARSTQRFRRTAGRFRFALGALLALAALIAVIGRVGPGSGKLFLAGISVLSTAGMIAGYVRDRRTIRSMREQLPGTGIRWASLEPRTLGQQYHPAWEAVPIAVLVLSAAFTAWAVSRGISDGPGMQGIREDAALRMIATLAIQGLAILGLMVLAFHAVLTSSSIGVRLPMFRDRPEAALAVDASLRTAELRYFIAARIGIALLLGFHQVEIAAESWDHPAAPWIEAGGWMLVILLLVLFAGYIQRLVKLSRGLVANGSPGA